MIQLPELLIFFGVLALVATYLLTMHHILSRRIRDTPR